MVPENIHTPPPHGGHFGFRPPTPLEFPFQGVFVRPRPPPPGIPSLVWHLLERLFLSKMLLPYTIMRKMTDPALKRKNPLFMLICN